MSRLPAAFLARPIAHRALHGAGRPENSLAAIRAAVAAGYGVEIDVQPASDGVAMVFHDDTLERLTAAAGPISARPAAELGRMPLTGGAAGIPTLAEALAAIGGQVPVLIEVKDRDGDMGPQVGPLEAAVIAALEGYAGDVAVMSFNPHSVDVFRRDAPDLPRGLVTSAFRAEHWPEISDATRGRLAAISDFDRLEADFISHEAAALDMAPVAALKARGVPVLCWTVRSAAGAAAARRVADNVTFEGYLP
ncbi:Glycerophosphoryl diester phosphodiesterase [Jannaschia seosinensis]|uniref:Glycerophosphoryl diester phosphodiesterase n=1 Tax=Jannaschia seosinensis TaxID=313367 RepID=A0A0M7B9C3_9RHOB|nr:glycerophosphodiester phosphodiesterase family protein [Jannaschia seosinensis]CUH38799.1 Glycerophosphoryl diester phosphodiesterase [Jannaschia seosinensis]